ncbi:MAG TPA: thiamine phosphate synthase [Bacteroidia bacterium]|jgi:thiamine-phosphate pyrophosphorylase|nr:thiamine phosphate synthase [Bacteroidia bacterium]
MKMIVLSPVQYKYDNETEIVVQLFEKGLRTYHLRKPFYKFSNMIDYLKNIPQKYHNRIVLHSHHSLIRKFNLEGVHYTRIHLEPTFKNWWNNKRLASYVKHKTQTASCKKLAELNELGDRHYSYVFLKPIFDSITGKYQSGYYEDSIKKGLQKTATRVIAMGGINIDKIEKVNELGFYGMALHNYIWESENAIERFGLIVKRCEKLGIVVE